MAFISPFAQSFQTTYKIGHLIGLGASGSVFCADGLSDGKKYAIKVFNDLTEYKQKKHLLQELAILAQAKHPSVISLVGFDLYYGEARRQIAIATKYMPNGSLADIF